MRARALTDNRTCDALRRVTQTTTSGKLGLLNVARRAPNVPKSYSSVCFHGLRIMPQRVCNIRLLLNTRVGVLSTTNGVSTSSDLVGFLSLHVTNVRSLYFAPKAGRRGARNVMHIVDRPNVRVVDRPKSKATRLSFGPVILTTGRRRALLRVGGDSLGPSHRGLSTHSGGVRVLHLYGGCRAPIVLKDSTRVSFSVTGCRCLCRLLRLARFPRKLVLGGDMRQFGTCLSVS